MKARWTDRSKPIIESTEPNLRYGPKFRHMRRYHINASISLSSKDEMNKPQMTRLIEIMEAVVKAFRDTEQYMWK